MKILIIEDERELAQSIKNYFQPNGVHCEKAGNYKTALEKISIYDYDCILLDLMLPDGDGFDILKELKNKQKTDGVIIISAKETLDTRIEGFTLGADDYLTKPVDKADLLRAVRTRLARVEQLGRREFAPNFNSVEPLVKLGLTARVAEVLLWVAQGKTNGDIAQILGISESTVKKHLLEIFQTLNVETRSAAALRAIEALASR